MTHKAVASILLFIYTLLTPNAIAQPKIEQGNTQCWYGRVNRWTSSEEILHQELDLMQRCGVTGYMIELAVWERSETEKWSDEWIRYTEKKYRQLLKECRKRDLWLFVSIVNDNMGKGKYGDTGPTLEKVYNKALKLVDFIKKYGPRHVVIQPVAETNTSHGEQFERHCIETLQDFILVYNGQYGYPKQIASGFDFRAVHPSHITSKVPSDALVISDHGLIIRELSIDGGLESKGHPDKIEAWVKAMKEQGVPVVGYYAFKYNDFDPDTISALGK